MKKFKKLVALLLTLVFAISCVNTAAFAAANLDELTAELICGNNQAIASGKLYLPSELDDGTEVTWTSNDGAVDIATGEILKYNVDSLTESSVTANAGGVKKKIDFKIAWLGQGGFTDSAFTPIGENFEDESLNGAVYNSQGVLSDGCLTIKKQAVETEDNQRMRYYLDKEQTAFNEGIYKLSFSYKADASVGNVIFRLMNGTGKGAGMAEATISADGSVSVRNGSTGVESDEKFDVIGKGVNFDVIMNLADRKYSFFADEKLLAYEYAYREDNKNGFNLMHLYINDKSETTYGSVSIDNVELSKLSAPVINTTDLIVVSTAESILASDLRLAKTTEAGDSLFWESKNGYITCANDGWGRLSGSRANTSSDVLSACVIKDSVKYVSDNSTYACVVPANVIPYAKNGSVIYEQNFNNTDYEALSDAKMFFNSSTTNTNYNKIIESSVSNVDSVDITAGKLVIERSETKAAFIPLALAYDNNAVATWNYGKDLTDLVVEFDLERDTADQRFEIRLGNRTADAGRIVDISLNENGEFKEYKNDRLLKSNYDVSSENGGASKFIIHVKSATGAAPVYADMWVDGEKIMDNMYLDGYDNTTTLRNSARLMFKLIDTGTLKLDNLKVYTYSEDDKFIGPAAWEGNLTAAGSVDITVPVRFNVLPSPAKLTLYMAVYDKDELVAVNAMSHTVTDTKGFNMKTSINNLPALSNAATCKAFIMDENLKPICLPFEK